MKTSNSLFAGMPREQLKQALIQAQQAYLALSTGEKLASASFAQGDGSNAVSYTRAEMPQLMLLIKSLQAQLGIIPRTRSPLRFTFC